MLGHVCTVQQRGHTFMFTCTRAYRDIRAHTHSSLIPLSLPPLTEGIHCSPVWLALSKAQITFWQVFYEWRLCQNSTLLSAISMVVEVIKCTHMEIWLIFFFIMQDLRSFCIIWSEFQYLHSFGSNCYSSKKPSFTLFHSSLASSLHFFTSFLSLLPSPSPCLFYFNLYPQGMCLQLAALNAVLWEVQIIAHVVCDYWKPIWSSSLFHQKLKQSFSNLFCHMAPFLRPKIPMTQARVVKVSCEFEYGIFLQSVLEGASQPFHMPVSIY